MKKNDFSLDWGAGNALNAWRIGAFSSRIVFLFVAVLISGNIFAKDVPLSKAKTVAENYYFSKKIMDGEKSPEFNKAYEHFLIGIDENNTAIYVFNIEKGFVKIYMAQIPVARKILIVK